MCHSNSHVCFILRRHGSSSLQVSSAHFAIVVEDDNKVWLPDPSCQQVRGRAGLGRGALLALLTQAACTYYAELCTMAALIPPPSIVHTPGLRRS